MTRLHHLSIGDLEVSTVVSDAPWNQNCYVVRERSSGAFIVVDPGFDSPELRDAIRAAGTQPEHILVTHGHPDHLGAAADLTDWLDVDCRIGRADARIARHAPAYAAAFVGLHVRAPDRVRHLDGGEVLTVGSTPVMVTAVPGHTPGSLAFSVGSIVLTGDTLFREHVGRTDFPGSDPTAIETSVDRLLEGRADDSLFMAGHGRPWTAGEARDWWTTKGRSGAEVARP